MERQVARALPLSRKLPLLVLGLLISVLTVTLGISYYEVRRSAELSAAERIATLAQVLANTVGQALTPRLTLAQRAAHDPAVVEALRNPTQPPSPGALKALSSLNMVPADSSTPTELWTPDGRPLGAVQLEVPADRQRFRTEILAAAAARPDSVHVGHISLVNGRASFYIAAPVRDADKQLVGFVVQPRRLAVNPRSLQPVRDLIGSDISLSLRNDNDDLWVQFDGARIPVPRATEPAFDSLQLLDRGPAGHTLSSTRKIPGTPLLVTVERPMSNILARPLGAIRALSIIAILLSVAGAVIAWLISRRLVRPLKDLTSAAEGMAQGNYAGRVEIGAADEVGRLGTAFNRMADQVQSSSQASADALARLTRAMETQHFLAEASRILAGSLSDDEILSKLARYCVPRLGDYCTLHVVDEDGSIRRIETAHRDPRMQEKVRELVRRFTYRLDGPGEVSEVIRTQQPVLVPRLDLPAIRARAEDPDTRRLLDEIQPHSVMSVPLVARGHTFGAISFATARSDREFTQDDVEVAMELARRASGAIDNAVIYQRSVALRTEAEAASNAKSDFLAKMSHEIRTPINAMMGYAELLQMGIPGPVNEAQARQLERIRASGDHLTMLVNEILDLAKIEAGRMAVRSSVAPAQDAVDTALTLIRPQATRKGVEISSLMDSGVEYVGDPQRVQQILTNLLSNAVKFTNSGGRVIVSCSRTKRELDGHDAEWTCIRVEDTGLGIQPEDIDRIFHPFVQIDSGYTRQQGGTGLGLTISQSLAHLMGGEITLESRPAVGSAFMLWLPCPNRAQVTA